MFIESNRYCFFLPPSATSAERSRRAELSHCPAAFPAPLAPSRQHGHGHGTALPSTSAGKGEKPPEMNALPVAKGEISLALLSLDTP